MEVGSEDVAKTGLKGKGLKLMHVYGDQLWGLGGKSSPDPSFTPQRIFPLQAKSSFVAVKEGCTAPTVMVKSRQLGVQAGDATWMPGHSMLYALRRHAGWRQRRSR